MKLFSLRPTTLKSKLYAIIFASFVVRVVAFFLLPSKGSLIPPDENGYSVISAAASTGKSVKDLLGGNELYLASRTLVLPASTLIRIGIEPVNAVRIVSSIYGMLSVYLVAFLILAITRKNALPGNLKSQGDNLFLIPFGIFAFLPSHLFWSILGLREAAMEFWVIATFVLLFLIFEVKLRNKVSLFLSFPFCILLVFSSRPQVGWLLGISLLFYLVFRIKERPAQILMPIVFIGVLFGYTVTTAYSVEITSTLTATAYPPTSPKEIAIASQLCKSLSQEVIVDEVKYVCVYEIVKKTVRGLKNPGKAIVDQTDAISYKHEVNKIDAASAIKTLECPNSGDSRFDNYFCLAYRAPYMTLTFLFRPIPGPDITSTASLFAAGENLLWLAMLLYIIIMFAKNRKLAFLGVQLPSLLFASLYCVAAGSYEGNMGTAFRHKSLILWVVILLLASTIVATQQRKAEQEGISGSSQE